MTEKEIIEGCQKGNRKAQNMLYHNYRYQLFGVCLRYSKDRQEAEDLLQEGFITIFKNLYQYRPIGSFKAWMHTVVVRVALQHVRRQKKLFSPIDINQLADEYQTHEDIFSDFRAKELIKMIQKLPNGYRAVFNLYVLEGYAHKEIAEMLGVTIGTSKSQLSKAKAMLKRMLEKSITT